MENKINISNSELSKRIYALRGVEAMLDGDLAEIYGVETKVLKQAVKRNLTRFPSELMVSSSNSRVNSISKTSPVTLRVPPSPPSGEGQYAVFLVLFPLSSCWRGVRGEVFEGVVTREFEEDTSSCLS
ncbi:MAG: ORF6N domain-containing protein [Myxococcaceae bacterium]